MNQNAWYWGTIFAAFALCMVYNTIIAPKFKLSRLKVLIITFFFFIFNWGITYLTAFIEAGFQPPGTANGVRAWPYVPLYFLACSLLFRIDFRKLSDAMTPCLILGFAFAHVGCVFTGCCNGYPYEGFGAIYNDNLQCNVFPIQLIESFFAYLLFFAFVYYTVKSKYKITGRQYPVMLIAYMGRIIFEFFRANEKLWGGISALSLHSLFGGVLGLVWLFFTTAKGQQVAEKIRNAFRKLFKKQTVPVLSVEEYKQQILETQNLLTNPPEVHIPDGELMQLQPIDSAEHSATTKKTKKFLIGTLIVSALVFALCVLFLLSKIYVKMAIILVGIFTVFSLFTFVYSCVMLGLYKKHLKAANIKPNEPCIFKKPDEEKTILLYRKNAYTIHFGKCPSCGKKLHLSAMDDKQVILQCNGKERHKKQIHKNSFKNVNA